MGETGVLSTLAAFLAEAIYAQGRYEEAERFTLASEEAASDEDAASLVAWRLMRVKVLARRREGAAAERLAREAVETAAETDFLHLHGAALLAHAEVLSLAASPHDAAAPVRDAVSLFRRKGNLAASAQAEALPARIEAGTLVA